MKTKLLLLLIMFFSNIYVSSAQKALNFDGVNDYVVGTNNASLNTSQGTIEAWIKTSNAGAGLRGIMAKPQQYGIVLKDNNLAVAEWGQGEKNTNVNLADGIWHHVAFSFNNMVANGSKLYIDGLPVLAFTYQVVAGSGQQILVGTSSKYQQYFNGAIDQVRVWNTQKTDAEILANYNKCLNGNETGLVMYWNFDEATGTTITDLSGNNNNGALTNMNASSIWVSGYDCNLIVYYSFNGNARDESGNGHHGTLAGPVLTTDKDGNAESAYYFDGADDYIDLGDWENGGAMTMTFWARWDAFNNYSRIIDLGNGSSSNNIIISNYQTNNGLFFSTYTNGETKLITTNTITQSQWDFYAATFGINGVMTVYKNGSQINQKTNGVKPNTLLRTNQFIGKSNFSQDDYFKGAIDELRIYQTTLSDTEILNLYTYNTLKVDKIENIATSTFYVFKNTLCFKNTQNIPEIKSVEIYNLLGQNVFKTSKITAQINLNQLQKGIYIVKVDTKNNRFSTLKFILQ
ncbi:putative secreted protein (Por secretion system target) [Mariniflexile fucanivorans]|uniref:Putative secreted protein (Por secretion system target) n=1 Tax=Mariniflexile fucanivorans TaxID=264023 RepID=A0A4R1RDW2_9FLAO|nr:LamG-like jellyroll fold domain-containing protein [Mariniflexile fucanivorans]TCL63830.1 putative secreted protein (Por secretion system target) [Mariniflexile fucanivorans]